MIKFYAYYNHGGYKDFYLGSDCDDTPSRYFLPLLQVHEQRLTDAPDAELQKEVDRQKLLPMLTVLTNDTTEYNYPDCVRRMVSHGGYKVLYRRIDQQHIVLAIRDIPGSKDVYGRSTPFCMMMIGDNSDIDTLDHITQYIIRGLTDFESFATTLFVNDTKENGLRFDLARLNDKIHHIATDASIKPTATMTESDKRGRPVCLFAHFMPYIDAINLLEREQKIPHDTVDYLFSIEKNKFRRMNDTPQYPFYEQPRRTPPVFTRKSYSNSDTDHMASLERRIAMLEERVNQLEQLLTQTKQQ